jgi:hypothetical protein
LKKIIIAFASILVGLASAHAQSDQGSVIYSAPKELVSKADLKKVHQASVNLCEENQSPKKTLDEIFLAATRSKVAPQGRMLLQAVSYPRPAPKVYINCNYFWFDYIDQE